MDIPVIVLFLVAVAVVLATSVLKQVEWPDKVKALVSTVVAVGAAAVMTLSTGDFDGENLLEASLVLYGLSQGFYQLIFKGTKPEGVLSHLGEKKPTEE